MSDFPHVPPPADGLRSALLDARRRRTRKAGAAGTTLACLAAVGWFSLGGAVRDSLVNVPPDRIPGTSTSASPSPGTLPVGGASPAALDSRSAGSAPVPSLSPAAVAPARTGSGTVTQAQSGVPRTASAMKRTDGTLTIPSNCTLFGGSGSGYCATDGGVRPSPEGYDLTAQLCSTNAASNVLHYRTLNEVRMTVTQHGRELWHWSHGHPDRPSAHAAVLNAGTCSEWTTTWTATDDSGVRLPAGTYRLVLAFTATELDGAQPVSTDLTIS